MILARALDVMADRQPVLRQAIDVLKPGGCKGEADEAWVQIREGRGCCFAEAGNHEHFDETFP